MKKILLAMLVTLSLVIPSAYASTNEVIDGDIGYEDGFPGLPSSAYTVNKKANSDELKNKIMLRFVPRDTNTKLSVPWVGQINNYYCGPASVQMVCDYFKKTTRTQNTYANDLGTTTDGTSVNSIPYALNKYIASYHYDVVYIRGFQDFLDKAYYTIKNKAPIIANMRSDNLSSGSWPYRVSGHFIVVSSMVFDANQNKFMGDIKDPWTYSPKQYQVSYVQLHDVIMANKGAMVY